MGNYSGVIVPKKIIGPFLLFPPCLFLDLHPHPTHCVWRWTSIYPALIMPRERRSSVQLKSYYDEHISSFHKEPFNFIADDGNAETTFRPRGWMRKRLGWILSIGLIVMIITTGYAVNTRTTRESDSDSEIDNIITSESIRVPANESNLVVSHGSTIPDLGWNATIHESLLHHVRELNEVSNTKITPVFLSERQLR